MHNLFHVLVLLLGLADGLIESESEPLNDSECDSLCFACVCYYLGTVDTPSLRERINALPNPEQVWFCFCFLSFLSGCLPVYHSVSVSVSFTGLVFFGLIH